MTNIFDTLVANGAYLFHNKFQSHKKYTIGFFVNINPASHYVTNYALDYKKY